MSTGLAVAIGFLFAVGVIGTLAAYAGTRVAKALIEHFGKGLW